MDCHWRDHPLPTLPHRGGGHLGSGFTAARCPRMTMWENAKCASRLAAADPLAVDRVLATDELDIGRAARPIDVERPAQGRDDCGGLRHPLGVEAEGADHLR